MRRQLQFFVNVRLGLYVSRSVFMVGIMASATRIVSGNVIAYPFWMFPLFHMIAKSLETSPSPSASLIHLMHRPESQNRSADSLRATAWCAEFSEARLVRNFKHIRYYTVGCVGNLPGQHMFTPW